MSNLILITDRLELIAATAEPMRLEMEDLLQLSVVLGVHVPDSWPPRLVGNLIGDHVIQRLAECPTLVGWSYWYWILRDRTLDRKTLIGRSHFCTPRCDGAVEIAYEVLEEFQGHGLGTEGVRVLTSWALSHSKVSRVVADAYSAASVRVLEKCGFRRLAEQPRMNMVQFEIARSEQGEPCGSELRGDPAGSARLDRRKDRSPWLRWWFGK